MYVLRKGGKFKNFTKETDLVFHPFEIVAVKKGYRAKYTSDQLSYYVNLIL